MTKTAPNSANTFPPPAQVQVYYPQILDKTRSFMLEWSKLTAGATSEGVLVDKINDWFSCMTADAVVKVGLAARLTGRFDRPCGWGC